MVAALGHQGRSQMMSRVTLWRILDEADLKPHRSVYWLNSHDPTFAAKARDICSLYVNALRFYEQGRLVICADEKTGMQMLQRKSPTQPAQPGKPEKRVVCLCAADHSTGLSIESNALVTPSGKGATP